MTGMRAMTQEAVVGLVSEMQAKVGLGDDDVMYQRPKGYQLSAVESSIYGKDERVRISRRTLTKNGLIPIDNDAEPSRYLLRCFLDWRVLALDILMIFSVVGTCILAPLTFIWGGTWEDASPIPGGRTLLQLDLSLDVIYSVHLISRLRTTYLHQNRRVEVVNDCKILRRHFLDPLYWFCWLSVTTHFWTRVFGINMLLNNLKVLRAIKELCFLPASMWRYRDTVLSRIGKPVLLLVLGAHWIACVLSNIGGFRRAAIEEGRVDEFETHFYGGAISGYFSLYLMAFVESIYMLTGALDNPLGDGSVREKQFGSLALVAIFGPIGCVVVSFFISAIVREQTLAHALDMKHEENKAFMRRALQNLDIPKDLQNRVFSLHEFQKMCHDREAFKALFNRNNLSPPLDLALRVYLYRDILCGSPYLKDKDPHYVLEIISGFEDQVYLPGDYVTRRGQTGSAMFFVNRGSLSVLVPGEQSDPDRTLENSRNVGKKKRGDYFGEIALIKDCVRTAWVRADQYVLVSMLTRAHAESIWKHYPGERQWLAEMVIATAQADRRRAATATSIESDVAKLYGKNHLAVPDALQFTPASNALNEAAEGNIERLGGFSYDNEAPSTGHQQLTLTLHQHIAETRRTANNHQLQFFELQRQQVTLSAKVDRMINLLTNLGDKTPRRSSRTASTGNLEME